MATTQPHPRTWSQHVTETSDAMTLEDGVFKLRSAKAIAESVLRSAQHSRRRKSSPYRSAMSMLTFYVNRAGHNLTAARRATLERAKDELRKLAGPRPNAAPKRPARRAAPKHPARRAAPKRRPRRGA